MSVIANVGIAREPSISLYHYTDLAGLVGIVKEKCLWATVHSHLNDAAEFAIAEDHIDKAAERLGIKPDDRNNLLDEARKFRGLTFVLSLSEKRNSLSQWRAYSKNGAGVAIGFAPKSSLFRSAAQHSFSTMKCVYDPYEYENVCNKLVKEFSSSAKPQQNSGEPGADSFRDLAKYYSQNYELFRVTAALKHSGFAEEAEWRVVCQKPQRFVEQLSFRQTQFGLAPYFKLPLALDDSQPEIDEVVLGPGLSSDANYDSVGLLLETHNIQVGKINRSDIPFRF